MTKVALDGVCSVASEEIHQEEWGIDVVLTATQKGLGTPPGLSIVNASQAAMKVCFFTNRLSIEKTLIHNFRLSMKGQHLQAHITQAGRGIFSILLRNLFVNSVAMQMASYHAGL